MRNMKLVIWDGAAARDLMAALLVVACALSLALFASPAAAHAAASDLKIGSAFTAQAAGSGHYKDAKTETESENNDSFTLAVSISLNKCACGTYSKSDDHDFFKVTALKTGAATITIKGKGGL